MPQMRKEIKMKNFKRALSLLLCLCTLLSLMTIPASAATKKIDSIVIELPKPELGKKLATKDDVWCTSSKYVEVAKLEWAGNVGEGNTAITDVVYSFELVLKIKDGQDAIFTIDNYKDIEINGKYLTNNEHGSVSDDGKTLTLYHRFPFVLTSSGKQSSLTLYTKSTLTLTAPSAGKKPATAAEINTNSTKIDITNVVWEGALDENGCFKGGVKYKIIVDIRLKDSVAGTFAIKPYGGTINSKDVDTATAFGDDHRKMQVTYTFPAAPDTAKITEKNNTRMEITAPKVGELPRFDPVIPADWKTYVKSAEWSGTFDKYGRFQAGKEYTLNVTVRVKPTSPDFILKKNTNNVINGELATVKSVSSDGKEMVLAYTFPKLEGSAPATPAGTKVDKFSAGDYGYLTLTGGTAMYYKVPDDSKGYDYAVKHANSGDTVIPVLEAGIKAGPNGTLWNVVLYKGMRLYMPANNREYFYTYADRTICGNVPVGTYSDIWSTDEKLTEGMIKTVEFDALVLEDGVPKMKFQNSTNPELVGYATGGYYADTSSIVYSTDKAEPYTFVTATVTYKPKGNAFFYEKVTHSMVIPYILLNHGNAAEIKYVDRNTLKITYTIFVEDLYNQDTYTNDMKGYSNSREEKEGYLTVGYFSVGGHDPQYVATAELYNPLSEWFVRMEFPQSIQELYADRYKNRTYNAPTDDGYVSFGSMTWGYKQTYAVRVYDLDVSDMFSGQMVGEWAQIDAGSFVPKAYLRNIDTTDNNVNGTPGHHVDPIYSFAGGSGTKEDPYLIATAEQLNAIRLNYAIGTYYKLIADIDLSNWGNWVPIGGNRAYGGWPSNNGYAHYNSFCFAGVVDGNGHTVSGMTIKIDEDIPILHTGNTEIFFGLFAATTGGGSNWGVIKNLTVKDFTIDVTYRNLEKSATVYAGGLAALSSDTQITGCKSVGGKINIQLQTDKEKDPDVNAYAGGLVGLSRNAEFTNCSSDSTVNVVTNTGEEFFDNIHVGSLVVKNSGKDITKLTNSKGTGKATESVGALAPKQDPKTASWAKAEVKQAAQNMLIDNTLMGDDYTVTINRLRFCSVAIKMAEKLLGYELPASPASTFTDTNDIYVLKAHKAGIVNGRTATTFDPNGTLDREQMATFIYRTLMFVRDNSDIRFTDYTSKLANYTDSGKISSWAKEPMAFMNALGLINGTSTTTLNPRGTCTIEQALIAANRSLSADKIVLKNGN